MNIEGWIEFDITDADMIRAERIAEETRREARKRGLEPIFQSAALENEILGLLGEGKFEDHLIELGIDYEKDRPLGRPDQQQDGTVKRRDQGQGEGDERRKENRYTCSQRIPDIP